MEELPRPAGIQQSGDGSATLPQPLLSFSRETLPPTYRYTPPHDNDIPQPMPMPQSGRMTRRGSALHLPAFGSKTTWRFVVWKVVCGKYRWWPSTLFQSCIMLLILANVILVIIDTDPYFDSEEGNKFNFYFLIIEGFSVTVFTIEYLLRMWCCIESPRTKSRLQWARSPLAIIDLLCLIPYLLDLVCFWIWDESTDTHTYNSNHISTFVRLLRTFSLLRMERNFKSFRVVADVFANKWEELVVSAFIMILMIIASSSLMCAPTPLVAHIHPATSSTVPPLAQGDGRACVCTGSQVLRGEPAGGWEKPRWHEIRLHRRIYVVVCGRPHDDRLRRYHPQDDHRPVPRGLRRLRWPALLCAACRDHLVGLRRDDDDGEAADARRVAPPAPRAHIPAQQWRPPPPLARRGEPQRGQRIRLWAASWHEPIASWINK